MEEKSLDGIVDFLFEVGILAKTPRSGFFFLGSGDQSVAEHLNRVAYIGFVLSNLTPEANSAKVLKMCLLHDLAEARVSDLNYVHQKYNERKEHKAIADLAQTVPFGKEITAILDEYHVRETLESKLAKDADNLEWILSLKEQVDTGNSRAKTWLPSATKRLLTEQGKMLATKILETDSDRWWFADKESDWWVTRQSN